MKCPFSIEQLSAYLDNELEPSLRARVEEHLRSCAACRAELEGLRAVDHLVKDAAVEQPSREFEFTLNRAVMAGIRRRPRSFVWRLMPALVPVAVAALALVIAMNLETRTPTIGMTERIAYIPPVIPSETKSPPAPAVVAREKIARPAAARGASRSDKVREEVGYAAARKDAAGEAAGAGVVALSDDRDAVAIPRGQIVRAIIDSTGRVLKVATGNTIVPEKDTLLEQQLEGQQFEAPEICGKRTQMYVDLTTSETETETR